MSAATLLSLCIIAWLIGIALILIFMHGASIASEGIEIERARGGAHGPPGTGVMREDAAE